MDKKEKNIVFIIGYMANGGAERVVSVLANEFAKRNFKVSILAILDDKIDYKLDTRIEYVAFKGKSSNKLKRIVERILFIRNYINKSGCSTIISFLGPVNIYSILANLFNRKRLIVSERNDPKQDPTTKSLRLIRNVLYEFADGVVFQTPEARDYFSKRIQERSIIIGNPLKDNLPNPFIGERKKEIVTAARLEEQKNIKMLIDAYYLIKKDYKEYKLKIYGEGILKQQLFEYVKKLGIENEVEFCGYSKDLHKKIIDASMFVLTSNYEGISNSLIEALALGIPTISTDHPVGGARMYIKPDMNGVLVPIGDTKATYEAMKKIINNKQLSLKMSKNAMAIRDRLKVEKITDEWENFILRDDIYEKNNY